MKVFHISEKPITNTMTPRIPESEYEDQKHREYVLQKQFKVVLLDIMKIKMLSEKVICIFNDA